MKSNDVSELVRAITEPFSKLPEVQAILLGGSHATGQADATSDIDLYIYVGKEIPVETKAAIIKPRASYAELDNRFWETEDNWLEHENTKVEIMYRGQWVADHLKNLLENHQAQMGYSTSIWHNVLTSILLFEQDDWYTQLQNNVRIPYSDELARAISLKTSRYSKVVSCHYPNRFTKL